MLLRTRLRAAAADERGWALVTAMILMTIMLGSTLGLAAFLDTQTTVSASQRIRESSFNLAEAALNQQVWNVGRDWPGAKIVSAGIAPYAACNETSTDPRCPNPDRLRRFIPTPDADPGATWTTQVLDNTAPYASFYSDALLATPVGYDANGDGFVWVRANARLRRRARTLVALVRMQRQHEATLQKAVVAGSINISNNGNKSLIMGGDLEGVAVRCTVTNPPSTACLGQPYDSKAWSKAATQIQPLDESQQQGYPVATAMSDDAIIRLRETARRTGTYVQDCATLPAATPGGIVFAEGGVCKVDGTANTSAAAPGFIINLTGTFQVGAGNPEYHGVLYAANRVSPTNLALNTTVRDVVTLQGTPVIWGGVLIDGNGVLKVGSSGGASKADGNIVFDGNAFPAIQTIASAGVLQNTWRELPAG